MNYFAPSDFMELRRVLIANGYSDWDLSNYERGVLEPIRMAIRDQDIDYKKIKGIVVIWIEGCLRYKYKTYPPVNPRDIEKFIFEDPLDSMPLFINDTGVCRELSKWRLRIGK